MNRGYIHSYFTPNSFKRRIFMESIVVPPKTPWISMDICQNCRIYYDNKNSFTFWMEIIFLKLKTQFLKLNEWFQICLLF